VSSEGASQVTGTATDNAGNTVGYGLIHSNCERLPRFSVGLNTLFVIPAKAGIHTIELLDSCLRRNDI
jgi:hypothetical protein